MVEARAVTFRQVLGNGTFLRLWIAQLVSQLGDWLASSPCSASSRSAGTAPPPT
jgi:hypothetical protein